MFIHMLLSLFVYNLNIFLYRTFSLPLYQFIINYTALYMFCSEKEVGSGVAVGVEDIVRNMKAVERAVLGFMCKQIIDAGRLMWMKERGLEAKLIKYVPSSISPENHLLIAKHVSLS